MLFVSTIEFVLTEFVLTGVYCISWGTVFDVGELSQVLATAYVLNWHNFMQGFITLMYSTHTSGLKRMSSDYFSALYTAMQFVTFRHLLNAMQTLNPCFHWHLWKDNPGFVNATKTGEMLERKESFSLLQGRNNPSDTNQVKRKCMINCAGCKKQSC